MSDDLSRRLLALEAHLGVAGLAPEFEVPKPTVIPAPGQVGALEVVEAWDDDPAEAEARIAAAEARVGESGFVVVVRKFRPLPGDVLAVPAADPERSLAAPALDRLDQLLGPSDAASVPRDDAPAEVHVPAPPDAEKSVAAEVERQAASYGPYGYHLHSFGPDGRCISAAGCLAVSPLMAAETRERERQEREIEILRSRLALEALKKGPGNA